MLKIIVAAFVAAVAFGAGWNLSLRYDCAISHLLVVGEGSRGTSGGITYFGAPRNPGNRHPSQ